jgi:hypothetical protein
MASREPCPINAISTVEELDALIAESETKLVSLHIILYYVINNIITKKI